uniref:Reverse transcriptase zinc-binding domain-containing protein n=1 Tax=Nelumbo nucifera TaxID=4432 RepID=A0A822XLK2_NELNU|nr:TPA_asm: hypothetical protein HUJ06_021524 [Nelumbo nucifera]
MKSMNEIFSAKKFCGSLWENQQLDLLAGVKWDKYIWKLKIPSKFKLFSWRLLRNFVLCRSDLVARGITNQSICIVCESEPEEVNHLFFSPVPLPKPSSLLVPSQLISLKI